MSCPPAHQQGSAGRLATEMPCSEGGVGATSTHRQLLWGQGSSAFLALAETTPIPQGSQHSSAQSPGHAPPHPSSPTLPHPPHTEIC